jgi:hypothetical protein
MLIVEDLQARRENANYFFIADLKLPPGGVINLRELFPNNANSPYSIPVLEARERADQR